MRGIHARRLELSLKKLDPRLNLLCQVELIAWCLRWPNREMLTELSIFFGSCHTLVSICAWSPLYILACREVRYIPILFICLWAGRLAFIPHGWMSIGNLVFSGYSPPQTLPTLQVLVDCSASEACPKENANGVKYFLDLPHQSLDLCMIPTIKLALCHILAWQEVRYIPSFYWPKENLIFVSASPQDRTWHKVNDLKVNYSGIEGRGSSGTSRGSGPAWQCWSSTHWVQCGPDEPSWTYGTYAWL